MKKSTKKRSTTKSSGGTGIALLTCFVIASIGVAVAIRQLALENRYFQLISASNQPTQHQLISSYIFEQQPHSYTLTLNQDRSVILSKLNNTSKESTTEYGSWSGDTNGTVIISVGDSQTYGFAATDNSLTLLNPDQKQWGTTKVVFLRKSD